MANLTCSVDAHDDGYTVLWMSGSADIEAHDVLKERMGVVREAAAMKILVDIRKLDFLTSLTLGELLSLSKAKKAKGGKVVIAGPNQYIANVFEQARVGRVIPIFDDYEKAAAACKNA